MAGVRERHDGGSKESSNCGRHKIREKKKEGKHHFDQTGVAPPPPKGQCHSWGGGV